VYGEPLVVNGEVIVATENDSVYALTPRGRRLWRRHLGTPVAQSALPCGDIDPLGITGTPVYDPKSGRLFVVAELAGRIRHTLFALNPKTGRVAWSHRLDPQRMHVRTQQQRAALAIANGRVWVAFGGLAGDCGKYHGWVIGVRRKGSGKLSVYRTPSRREAGIWAPSGPAVDRTGHLYVAVGNGASTAPPYDKSDSILRLLGKKVVSLFAPKGWAAENASDKDLGSTGPAIVRGAGRKWIFADGKGDKGYLLRPARLGGIGGQRATFTGCTSFGGTAFHARTIYVPCTDGIRALRIGKKPSLRVVWHNASTGFGSAPVLGGGALWALNGADKGNNRLLQINPATGRTVTSIGIPTAPHFATPTLHGSLLLIGTVSGVAAVWTS
jgi:outer membrane protein assembly factor BamB